ncbi:unnamed protein product [Rotaria sp. Silwood1]|nr:unnamed protein product [Rotaria sp. Silwood1]
MIDLMAATGLGIPSSEWLPEIIHISPLQFSSSTSNFRINDTIETLVYRLFIDYWSSEISYERYYNACAPTHCTYFKEEFVFCSTDQLREEDPSKWNEYCNKWIKNREINLSPRLTYVDFSYVTSFHLLQTQIFSLYPAADVKRTFAFPNLPISPAARSIQLLDKQLKQTRRRVTLPKLVHFSKTNPKSSELEAIVHIDNAQSTSQSSENLTSENVFKLNEQYNKTEIKHYELISSKNPILKKTTKEIRNSPTVSSLLSTRTHTFTLEKQADTTEQYTNVPGTYSNSTLTSMLQKKHKGENTKQRIDQTNSQKLSSIRYASKQKQAYLIQEQNYKSNSLPQLNSTNIPTNMLYHD